MEVSETSTFGEIWIEESHSEMNFGKPTAKTFSEIAKLVFQSNFNIVEKENEIKRLRREVTLEHKIESVIEDIKSLKASIPELIREEVSTAIAKKMRDMPSLQSPRNVYSIFNYPYKNYEEKDIERVKNKMIDFLNSGEELDPVKFAEDNKEHIKLVFFVAKKLIEEGYMEEE